MQINLSDETLDHLRYHLDVLAKQYLKLTEQRGTMKRAKARDEAKARLAEVRDLLAIFEPAETPAPEADFRVTQDGSVFVFYPQSDKAKAHVITAVRPAGWQMLGGFTFAVDHRLAPDVCYQLREDGYTVVVR